MAEEPKLLLKAHVLHQQIKANNKRLKKMIGHSLNLVGVSTSFLASPDFNAAPRPLHIAGVREMNGSMFEMLSQAEDLNDAGQAFLCYMQAMFGIDSEQQEKPIPGRPRRYRSSFLRLLKGWGYDSNSPEGAVLKGWAESRFGLFPTYHKGILSFGPGENWSRYVEEKMSSRFHNNSIYTQLDMLFEFCQWALAKFAAPGQTHIRLYRGTNSFDEYQIIEKIDKHNLVVRINNLASFTPFREIADCFGDILLEAAVPLVKILFFNNLLTIHPLKGESEYLVIGGDYLVSASYY